MPLWLCLKKESLPAVWLDEPFCGSRAACLMDIFRYYRHGPCYYCHGPCCHCHPAIVYPLDSGLHQIIRARSTSIHWQRSKKKHSSCSPGTTLTSRDISHKDKLVKAHVPACHPHLLINFLIAKEKGIEHYGEILPNTWNSKLQGDIGKVDYFMQLAGCPREMHSGDFKVGDPHTGKPWGWGMGLRVSCKEAVTRSRWKESEQIKWIALPGDGFCLCPLTWLDFRECPPDGMPEILATARRAVVGHKAGAEC